MRKLYSFSRTFLLLFLLFLGAASSWATDYYTRVTSGTIGAGTYIITNSNHGVMKADAYSKKPTAVTSNITYDSSNDKFVADSYTNAHAFTVAAGTNGGLTFKFASTHYLYYKGSGTDFTESETMAKGHEWTVEFDNGYARIKNVNTTGRAVIWNGSAFGPFATSNISSGNSSNTYSYIYLYKLEPGSSDPCTVTFNVGDHGTCSTESLTEASAGAGVTLPNVTAKEGWYFEGWSKDETPTSANAGAAGETFKPTQNCTVYAYYKVIPATPTFNVQSGEVEKGTTITLSCTTDGATIKYTTDGSIPTSSSSTYSSAITLNADQTIKAIAVKDGVSSAVASATYTIATHTAQFSINGEVNVANNKTVAKGEAITFPANPEVDGVKFMGWMKGIGISGTQETAPTMVDKSAEKMGTDNVTYYAVFAVAEEGGASSYKEVSSVSEGTYVLVSEKTNNKFRYMPSTASTSSNPTLGEGITMSTSDGVTSLTNSITDNMLWDLVSTGSANQFYIRPHGSSTIGLGTTNSTGGNIRISSNYVNTKWTISTSTNYNWQFKNNNTTAMYLAVYADSNWRNYDNASTNQNGKFYLFKEFGGISYTDYCTTVSLDPQPTIVLSETALTEYAGNTNNSISVSVSEQAYTGTLEASSDKEAVATASISDGKVVINALTAGTANITITAPAITGFRKNTATIAVTVKNKLNANLVFAKTTQTVSMDAEPFAAYAISSKATDAETVTYSLDIKGDDGNAIAVLNMVEGVPMITLSGTKATTTTRTIEVVATTEETHTYAAGEARYQLIVTKRDPQIAWSASEVTIDLNEEENLPTLSNPRGLTITYNSTNKDVADFNEGVLELKKAGKSTIQASIGTTAYYDAKTVSYELTFAPRYTVSFKYTDDTKAAEDLREETTGAGVTLPANPGDMEGYRFLGWATTKEATSADAGAAGANYKPSDNETLYAFYSELYTVKFLVNGEQYGETQSLINRESVEFPATKPSDLGGKTFVGWAMEEVNGIDEIKPTTYTEFTIDNDDVTFFAVFATESSTALDYTFTIVPSNFVNGYDSNNGSHDITAKCTTDNSKTLTISYATQSVGEVSGKIQFKKSGDGYLYNTTDLGSITSVTIADGSNLTTYYGTSQKPTSSTSVGTDNGYFRIVAGSSAGTCSSITVTFTKSDYTYSDYCTKVSESITLTNPTEAEYGFATFCGEANYTVSGAKAYKAKVENGVLVLTELTGVIPAGNSDYENGVVIAGTPGKTATIRYTTEEATADMTGNQLLGTLAVTSAETLKNGADYLMVFSKSNGGFVSYTGVYVPAYKACLPYSDNAGAPMRMVFGRDNLPTNNVNVNVNDNQGTKVMIDGRLYILRDGKTYDSFGRLVK